MKRGRGWRADAGTAYWMERDRALERTIDGSLNANTEASRVLREQEIDRTLERLEKPKKARRLRIVASEHDHSDKLLEINARRRDRGLSPLTRRSRLL